MQHPNSYYIPKNWPTYSLKLTHEGALNELFKAGLRPGYTSMANNTELDVKHVRLRFILADGRHLPEFAAEYGRITVTRAGLTRLTFISQPLSVVEAKATMVKWLPYFSEKRRKTEVQLGDFLQKVGADYSGYDDPNFGAAPEGFGGGWKDENGVGYGVRFQKAYNEVVPVRIYLNVVWHYVRTDKEERAFYREPIPSPEGYKISTLKEWGPDSTSEMMYAKGIPFPPGRGLSGRDDNNVIEVIENQGKPQPLETKHEPNSSIEGENTLEPVNEPSRLPWIIAGFSMLGVLGIRFMMLKGKRHH